MGGKSAPSAPDPVKTAAAQASANKEAAIASGKMNMVDQFTPWGSMRYEQIAPMTTQDQIPVSSSSGLVGGDDRLTQAYEDYDYWKAQPASQESGYALQGINEDISNLGGNVNDRGTPQSRTTKPEAPYMGDDVPRYRQYIELAPEQQRILDLENQATEKYGQIASRQFDNLDSILGSPMDLASLGAAPVMDEGARQRAADAMYGRLNPQLDRDRAALETRLANQGITMGSDAWKEGMGDFNRSANDARMAVDAQAGNEMARDYGLQTAARQNQINEMMMGRTQPLNELAALLSGVQVQGPQFAPSPQTQVQPADVMGATYANYNAQNNAAQANTQGLYGLAGAGLGAFGMLNPFGWGAAAASDRRLKRDIRRVGVLDNGLPVYAYRFDGSDVEHLGLMADEVREIHPEAVISENGYDAVIYGEAVR